MYERRFKLTSTQTGLEASFYDIIAGCSVRRRLYFLMKSIVGMCVGIILPSSQFKSLAYEYQSNSSLSQGLHIYAVAEFRQQCQFVNFWSYRITLQCYTLCYLEVIAVMPQKVIFGQLYSCIAAIAGTVISNQLFSVFFRFC